MASNGSGRNLNRRSQVVDKVDKAEGLALTETERLLGIVLSLEGVHTVYPARPARNTAATRIGTAPHPAARQPGSECLGVSTDGTFMTLSVRVGVDGSLPAAQVARNVAAALRADLGGKLTLHCLKISVEVSSLRHLPPRNEARHRP